MSGRERIRSSALSIVRWSVGAHSSSFISHPPAWRVHGILDLELSKADPTPAQPGARPLFEIFKGFIFETRCVCETQMPPIMANSNEGQDHKDKYFDTSRNIL